MIVVGWNDTTGVFVDVLTFFFLGGIFNYSLGIWICIYKWDDTYIAVLTFLIYLNIVRRRCSAMMFLIEWIYGYV